MPRGTSLGSGKASRNQKEETSDWLIKDRKEQETTVQEEKTKSWRLVL